MLLMSEKYCWRVVAGLKSLNLVRHSCNISLHNQHFLKTFSRRRKQVNVVCVTQDVQTSHDLNAEYEIWWYQSKYTKTLAHNTNSNGIEFDVSPVTPCLAHEVRGAWWTATVACWVTSSGWETYGTCDWFHVKSHPPVIAHTRGASRKKDWIRMQWNLAGNCESP